MEGHHVSMNFGIALEKLKHGVRVARTGWNGKGMWLVLVKPRTVGEESPHYTVYGEWPDASAIQPLPWIGMKTADSKFVPWLATQTDVLAEDWEVVP
jgi:hypothetical protein